jgi:subtilase family serine protease
MDFSVSLRMRNFDELEARIQAGDKISAAEMEARYLPLQSDYDRTAAWLVSEGFTLTTSDPNHTNLFARGTVAAVAKSFGVTFARVATDDGEFTSAVTIPSLPADVAEPILGIDGLQPHRQAHRLPVAAQR